MTHFVLIPLIPLLASFIILIGGHRWGEKSHLIGIPAIGLSFALSVAAFIEVLINGPFTISLYRLFESGSLVIDLTLFVGYLINLEFQGGYISDLSGPYIIYFHKVLPALL